MGAPIACWGCWDGKAGLGTVCDMRLCACCCICAGMLFDIACAGGMFIWLARLPGTCIGFCWRGDPGLGLCRPEPSVLIWGDVWAIGFCREFSAME